MVYGGKDGGAVPKPVSGIDVVFKMRSPLAMPIVVGAKVIVKWPDWLGAKDNAGADTVNGPFAGLAPIREMVVACEPELVTVKVSCSDLPTATEPNTTAPPVAGFTGMVPELELYE